MDHETLRDLLIRLCLIGGFTYISLRYLLSAIDPTSGQKEDAKKLASAILQKLGMDKNIKLDEYELLIAQHVVVPSEGVDWSAVGGYAQLISEIKDTLLLPLSFVRSTPLLAPPKGVLLHGPPGCGKTLLAKAVAKSAGARFINLQFSTMTDKWYGETQKLAAATFSLAKKLQPCIVFIDEIDSFLRSRETHDHEATAMMKAQFLSLWDGFESDPKSEVVVMGATNRPRDVDVAIMRRMPLKFHVGMPDSRQRHDILRVILSNEELDPSVDLAALASAAENCSGSDLKEICRYAAVYRMKEVINELKLRQNLQSPPVSGIESTPRINQSDLDLALKRYLDSRSLGSSSLLSMSNLMPISDALD